MAQAAKKPSTTSPSFLHPEDAPKVPYALVTRGTCMEPEFRSGAKVLVDPTASFTRGDVVCIYLKEGIVSAAGTNIWIKRGA